MTGGSTTPPRVVCLNGSENPGGATGAVLERFSDELRSRGVESIVVPLASADISGCGPCGDCNLRTEQCALQDDVEDIVRQMVEAEGVVYASPVHGFGLAAPMQTFIERAGVGHLRFSRPLADKVGGALVVGRRYAHSAVLNQLHQNILLNRMILPGSGYPAIVRTEQGDPDLDHEGMAAVRAMAIRMVEVIFQLRGTPSRNTGLAANERSEPAVRGEPEQTETKRSVTP